MEVNMKGHKPICIYPDGGGYPATKPDVDG